MVVFMATRAKNRQIGKHLVFFTGTVFLKMTAAARKGCMGSGKGKVRLGMIIIYLIPAVGVMTGQAIAFGIEFDVHQTSMNIFMAIDTM